MQQMMEGMMHENETSDSEADASEVLEADARNLMMAHMKDAFGPRCIVSSSGSCGVCRAWEAFDVLFGDEHDPSQYVLDEMSWDLSGLDDEDEFVASVTREVTKNFGEASSVTTLVDDGALTVRGLMSVGVEDAFAFLYRVEALFMLHTQRELIA